MGTMADMLVCLRFNIRDYYFLCLYIEVYILCSLFKHFLVQNVVIKED